MGKFFRRAVDLIHHRQLKRLRTLRFFARPTGTRFYTVEYHPNSLSAGTKTILNNIFDMVDTNRNGHIDCDEMREFYDANIDYFLDIDFVGGHETRSLSRQQSDDILEALDLDFDEQISREEFQIMWLKIARNHIETDDDLSIEDDL